MRKVVDDAGISGPMEHHRSVENDVLGAMKKPGILYWLALLFTGSCFALGMGHPEAKGVALLVDRNWCNSNLFRRWRR